MHGSVTISIWASVAYLAYWVVSAALQRQRFAARAAAIGAKDAPEYPNVGFAGLKHLKLLNEADKKNLFPDLLVHREEVMTETQGHPTHTFHFSVLFQKFYATSDPKNIQHMLAHQFQDFDLGSTRHGIMSATLGDGIFVQDGKAWEHSRAMLRPNFARDQISDLELEEHHVQDLMKVLAVNDDGWTSETNLQALFFRLTLDSACEFLFGESVDSQLQQAGFATSKSSAQGARENAFSNHFDAAGTHMAKRFRLGDLYWLHNPKVYREDNRIVNDFVQHYVDKALANSPSEKKMEEGEAREKYVFLDELVKQTRNPTELRAQLLNILLAGRDTTASLLSWLFVELLRHPEVFEKLRSVILEAFGTYENPHDISFATLKGCQYLQYVLNETNRLHTIVPGNSRRSNKETTLPRGGGPDGLSPILIPANTEVTYHIHITHQRKDLWGEDASEFKPERFQGRKPGWEFLPFNGGPRICIGQQFALTEASYVVVRLLQRFDKIWASEDELEDTITTRITLTSCPGRPVTLKLHEAK